ncbi:MAG: hypothetical protein DMF72_20800 [Acidobacteria bacterium]|nr:MAG: hypothetical protein DMF72_20800 [Acidobacteriota bacterium]
MPDKSKNDVAWESLFETHRILDHIDAKGVYEISATSINTLREARLMTKFDHRIQLPTIFKQNDLTIQPNTRGTYLIGHFASYFDLPADDDMEIEQVSFPSELETINPQNLYSESAALLCAYNSGIIERLLGESVSLTVFGRMSTGQFNYIIDDNRSRKPFEIRVHNSQCEIDSGFEGQRFFSIIEAKNEEVNDLLVRQLYYPYRLWTEKTQKEIIPVFLSYSNDVFSFYVFRFGNHLQYNSIELIERRKFQIGQMDIELQDVMTVLDRVRVLPEPGGIPFPQADSFNRIVDLLTQIRGAGVMSQEDITTNHAFDLRQTQYYTNAARYLGFVTSSSSRVEGVTYTLTPKGVDVMAKRPALRNLALAETILEHQVFNNALRLYLTQAGRPTTAQVVELMRSAKLGLGATTIPRRAQTVLSWIDWIMRLTRP